MCKNVVEHEYGQELQDAWHSYVRLRPVVVGNCLSGPVRACRRFVSGRFCVDSSCSFRMTTLACPSGVLTSSHSPKRRSPLRDFRCPAWACEWRSMLRPLADFGAHSENPPSGCWARCRHKMRRDASARQTLSLANKSSRGNLCYIYTGSSQAALLGGVENGMAHQMSHPLSSALGGSLCYGGISPLNCKQKS